MQTALDWIALVSGLGALITVVVKWIFGKGWSAKDKEDMQNDIAALKKDTPASVDGLRKNMQQSMDEIRKDIKELTNRVGDVDFCAKQAKMMIEPWWNVINTHLPDLLNVSHSENLVAKLSDGRITDDELEHLEQEVKVLLIQDKESGKVLVDLLALWAIQVRRIERSGKKVC